MIDEILHDDDRHTLIEKKNFNAIERVGRTVSHMMESI